MKKKGLFITFEGGEGAGKSSLIQYVQKGLESQDYQTVTLREPGSSSLGEKIRQLLLESSNQPLSKKAELMLFLASRAQLIEESILPAIEKGHIVLCDRYNDSTIAYQGEGRGLGSEFVKSVCDLITKNCIPDLTILLDVPVPIGLKRAKSAPKEVSNDRFESETLAFHEKIRAAYLKLLQENPKRMVLVDAARPLSEVSEKTLNIITQKLQQYGL